MYLDARIVDLSRPSGLVTRQALIEAGLKPSAIDRRLRIGSLVAVRRGVYRVATGPEPATGKLWAAVLAAGHGATVSHGSAAEVYDLLPSPSGPVDLTVPGTTRRCIAGVRVHRSGDLLPGHVRAVDGLPVTTVERTLADLGDVAPELAVARAMEKAVIDRRTTVERLEAVLDEIGRQGRNGRRALRRAVEGWQFAGRPPDSVLEVVFGRLLDRLGIPRPRFQYEVHDRGALVARVDACWPARRLIAEVDGHHFHASRTQFEHDLRRQNRLVGLGYAVVRFTWQDVTRSAPRVGSTLRHHLAIGP